MCFGATAACVLAGVVIAMITAANKNGHFHPAAARAANELAFFTIWSNLLVGLGMLLLAVRLDRSSTAFAVLRLSGLVAIIFTGVATGVGFEFAQMHHLKGWGAVWNVLLHTVVPVVAVVGWLLIGPRRIVSRRVAWLSVIFPVCYLAFTLIRGAIVCRDGASEASGVCSAAPGWDAAGGAECGSDPARLGLATERKDV